MDKLKPLFLVTALSLTNCASVTNKFIREKVGGLLQEASEVAPDIEDLKPFRYVDIPFEKDGEPYELSVVKIPNERKNTGITLSLRVRAIGGGFYKYKSVFIPYRKK